MSRTYSRFTCRFCGNDISNNGLARTNHMRKHVREGLVREVSIYWKGVAERRFEAIKRPPPTAEE